jgi:NAD(P)-dependent dehydrogenase (short-subunit alcohol dehydrogenase family)
VTVNLTGTMLALHDALPMLERHGGRTVAFSGGGATGPMPRYDAYAASKVGVVRLTENVAADKAVELNCVAHGIVATRIHEGTRPTAAGIEYYKRTVHELETGGLPVTGTAEFVCFLFSAAARAITGRLISAQCDPWREPEFENRLCIDPAFGRPRRIDRQFGDWLAHE